MTDLRLGLSWRRKRTSAWKARARQKFWTEHGEKVRVALIGGGMILLVCAFAAVAIH
jgi:hypothetical protein